MAAFGRSSANLEGVRSTASPRPVIVHVGEPAANLFEPPDRDVAGDERVRHARKTPLLQVYVRPADLAQLDGHQRRALLQLRLRDLAQLDRLARPRHQRHKHSAHAHIINTDGAPRERRAPAAL